MALEDLEETVDTIAADQQPREGAFFQGLTTAYFQDRSFYDYCATFKTSVLSGLPPPSPCRDDGKSISHPSIFAVMDKDFILEQIRLFAAKNAGRTPGREAFEKATGIKETDWSGRYWTRWSEAVSEAGLPPNVMQAAYDQKIVAEKFISLIRELGKFPVSAEVKLKAKSDRSFPSHNAITRHLGNKSDRAAFIKSYCEEKEGMEDVIEICMPIIKPEPVISDDVEQDVPSIGYVYLFKSGKFYKIGSTNNPDRRQYEIGIQLPEKIHHIHSIETDDPSGIEAYWHRRFREKRLQGEWFDLNANDIKIFRRRTFM